MKMPIDHFFGAKRLPLDLLGVGALFFLTTIPAALADDGLTKAVTPNTESPVLGSADFAIPMTQLYELVFVGILGLAVLILQGTILIRAKASPQEGLRLTLVTLIVTLSVGMLIFGFNSQQIATVTGLFGSVIGYLLGRSDKPPQ